MLFVKTRDVKSPKRGTEASAGIDFFVPNDWNNGGTLLLEPGKSVNIPSGLKILISSGLAGIFFNKSGIAIQGLQVGACVVDSDYRGEVHLNVHNHSNLSVAISPGQKLVQMLLMPIRLDDPEEIQESMYQAYGGETERGSGGFGSTGKF